MSRWWFVILLVGAMFVGQTRVAFAGCEGGDSTMGNSAIAFCCNGNSGRGQDSYRTGARPVVSQHLR